jgi:hypothetical protein
MIKRAMRHSSDSICRDWLRKACGSYGCVLDNAPHWARRLSDGIGRRARMSSCATCRGPSSHGGPPASRRNVCPQKYKQDSYDYIAPGPRDVRRPCPALPLLVRLRDDVAHDVPLALLAVYSPYGSTVPPNAGYVLGADLNCSESVGCHRQRTVIHPFEIADVSEANLSG